MAYPTMAVANAFIKRAKEGRLRDLTPMKLQKLLFFAQSWHLKIKNNEALLDEYFCRWQYGPVIPSLYHEFKNYGSFPITDFGVYVERNGNDLNLIQPIIPDTDIHSWSLIDRIIEVYGPYNGAQLSNITHQPNTAWAKTGDPDGGVITNDQLAQYIG